MSLKPFYSICLIFNVQFIRIEILGNWLMLTFSNKQQTLGTYASRLQARKTNTEGDNFDTFTSSLNVYE